MGRAKVILAAPDTSPLALGGPGAAIWMALDDPGTEADVLDRLKDLGDLPPSTLVTDAFVHLLEAGIIEPVPR